MDRKSDRDRGIRKTKRESGPKTREGGVETKRAIRNRGEQNDGSNRVHVLDVGCKTVGTSTCSDSKRYDNIKVQIVQGKNDGKESDEITNNRTVVREIYTDPRLLRR